MNRRVQRWLVFHLLLMALGSAVLVVPINRNLEYEFSQSLSWLLMTLALAASGWKRLRAYLIQLPASHLISGLVALLAPALLWRLLGHCPCYPREIALWLILSLLPSWFIAWGLVSSCHCLSALTPRLKWVVGTLLLSSLLLWPLGELWFLPQKRSTSLIYGIIHGPIYDSWLPVDSALLWRRLVHGLIGILAYLLARPALPGPIKAMGLTFLLACNLGLQTLPSQSHGIHALTKELTQQRPGPGFLMHLPQDLGNRDERRAQQLFRQASFHSKSLSQFFPKAPPVQIFVYRSREQKKLIFGGGGTDITDVVTPSIHINLAPWPHPTLRHELVHAMASSQAFHGLGFHPNMAFTEGLAVALAPQERTLSLDESVMSLMKQKKLPELGRLFSPLFWTVSGSRAYRTAGSFIRYLKDRFGPRPLIDLYNGAPWSEAIGIDQARVLEQWLASVKQQQGSTATQDQYGESLFRHPGILGDLCPHSKALLAQTSSQQLTPGLRRAKNWSPKLYWQWRQTLEPDSRRVRYQAQLAKVKELVKAGERSELLAFVARNQQVISSPSEFLEDFWTKILLADVYFWLGDYEADGRLLQQLKSSMASSFVGFPTERQLLARLIAGQGEPVSRKLLRGYLAGFTPWSKLTPSPHWLYRYLHVRRRGTLTEEELGTYQQLGLPAEAPIQFKYQWHRQSARLWFGKGDFTRARQSLESARELAHAGAREHLDLLLAELRFYEAQEDPGGHH